MENMKLYFDLKWETREKIDTLVKAITFSTRIVRAWHYKRGDESLVQYSPPYQLLEVEVPMPLKPRLQEYLELKKLTANLPQAVDVQLQTGA